MKRFCFIVAMSSLAMGVGAQEPAQPSVQPGQQRLELLNEKQSEYIPVLQYWKEHDILQHLDLSVTLGSMGVGLEVSSPIGEYFQVRAGYEFTPRFTKRLRFNMMLGDESAVGSERFERRSQMMESISGYKLEDHVDMIAKPTMNHAKLLLDVFPFKNNKHWHFTAGLYWGPKQVAVADNCTEAMASLLSVGMYNRMYERAEAGLPLVDFYGILTGIMGMDPDDADEYISKNHLNVIPVDFYNTLVSSGRLSFDLGYFNYDVTDDNGVEHKAGERYKLVPGSDGMIHVKAKANSLKPYLGFGYGGRLVKGRDDWQISFDAGALFWGGSPGLYTHDGINLVKDVRGISGQVGNYVDVAKAFKVYPVLSLKITKRIF